MDQIQEIAWTGNMSNRNNGISLDEFLDMQKPQGKLAAVPHGMRVLLANKKSVANALIRQYNRLGKPTWNIQTMTVVEIAKELLLAFDTSDRIKQRGEAENGASDGDEDVPRFITGVGADYCMLSVVSKGNYETFPKETLTMETAHEIRAALDELRMNLIAKEYHSLDAPHLGEGRVASKKMDDLKAIWKAYEAMLERKGYYDDARMLNSGILLLINMLPASFHQLLPWSKNVRIGDLETNRWSVHERLFIDSFAKKASSNKEGCQTVLFMKDLAGQA